ncbi:MAG: phosphate ABC transporter permease PstA [Chloroflexia bacterium]|nr:phosphate ABC transporter permease PstA [Chloroflexia bacterium]
MSVHAEVERVNPASGASNVHWDPRISGRRAVGRIWRGLFFGSTAMAIVLLGMLLWSIMQPGWGWLSWHLITEMPSRNAEDAGFNSAIWGSVWIVIGSAIFSFFVGVGTAIYLEEYAPRNRYTRFLQTNISNLAGVPSVVYGLLGLVFFVQWLNLGRSISAGALTMGLLILPVVVISSQEAIRAVPLGLRQGAYALGATKWQTVRSHVLPTAMPGILTGMILSMSRAIGETAPLIVVGASSLVLTNPGGPLSSFTAMPVQIFNWSARPQQEFEHLAAAAILVLLTVLLSMNALAIFLRQRLSNKNRM